MSFTFFHARVEQQFRAALAAAELPEPDHVEYWAGELAFFWDGPKVMVVVDLQDGGALSQDELREVGLLH
jgi:hypothetical protein